MSEAELGMDGKCWHCGSEAHDTAGHPGRYRGGAVDGPYDEFIARQEDAELLASGRPEAGPVGIIAPGVEVLEGSEAARAMRNAERRRNAETAPIRVAAEVLRELRKAREKHAPMHSAHEGYAVLLEESDELWAEVKAQKPSVARMRAEALQVAAMAMRFVLDVCGGAE